MRAAPAIERPAMAAYRKEWVLFEARSFRPFQIAFGSFQEPIHSFCSRSFKAFRKKKKAVTMKNSAIASWSALLSTLLCI